MADPGSVQVLFVTAKGDYLNSMIYCLLMPALDALLWIQMRKVMHDAVFPHIINPRFNPEPSGLCRSGNG
jgi:hypothetical protein